MSDNNYIGKTTRNFKKRYGSLKGFIREKKTTDSIQEDLKEYGIDSFEVFEEIDCVYMTNDEEYDKDLLSITESYYIKKYNGYGGYNEKMCDYPLCISLYPQVFERGLYIRYKFELEDYYNFLFTDRHLKHFNKLTDPNKKYNYCERLKKKYDEENDFDYKFIKECSLFSNHFKGDITIIRNSNKYRWFNHNDFRKYHSELYLYRPPHIWPLYIDKCLRCITTYQTIFRDGLSEMSWFNDDELEYIALDRRFNNTRYFPKINTRRCIYYEERNIEYLVFVKYKNLVYMSNSVKFDELLYKIVNTLNNDFENRNERFKNKGMKKHYYINEVEELIKIRNDKLIQEVS